MVDGKGRIRYEQPVPKGTWSRSYREEYAKASTRLRSQYGKKPQVELGPSAKDIFGPPVYDADRVPYAQWPPPKGCYAYDYFFGPHESDPGGNFWAYCVRRHEEKATRDPLWAQTLKALYGKASPFEDPPESV